MKRDESIARGDSLLNIDRGRNRIGRVLDPTVQSLFENLISALSLKETFSEEEAAAYMKTDVKSIRYYALRVKELAYHKVGKSLVFTKKDLDAFLASKRVMSING